MNEVAIQFLSLLYLLITLMILISKREIANNILISILAFLNLWICQFLGMTEIGLISLLVILLISTFIPNSYHLNFNHSESKVRSKITPIIISFLVFIITSWALYKYHDQVAMVKLQSDEKLFKLDNHVFKILLIMNMIIVLLVFSRRDISDK